MTARSAHLRELLRFEEQRLGCPVRWAPAEHSHSAETGVTLTLLGAEHGERSVTLPLPSGRHETITVRRLATTRPHLVPTTDGVAATAEVIDQAVRCAVDLDALGADGRSEALSLLWDRGIAHAIELAARDGAARREAEAVETFVRLEQQARYVALRRMRRDLESAEAEIDTSESRLNGAVGAALSLRRCVRDAESVSLDAVREDAARRHAELQRLVPGAYRSVRVEGNSLVADTHEIEIDHDGRLVGLGRFRIHVTLEPPSMRIENLTRPLSGTQHPHVSSPTAICWGNVGPGVSRLLAERELAGLLTIVLRFLRSYEPRDAFRPIEDWEEEHGGHGEDDDDDDGDEGEDGEDGDAFDDEPEESEADDAASSRATFDCRTCGGRFIRGHESVVEGRPTCRDCIERDTFTCTRCGERRFVRSRDGRSCERCTEVSASERNESALSPRPAGGTESGSGPAPAVTAQEVSS